MPEPRLFILPREPARRRQAPNNLPLQHTPLVGREQEVEDVLNLLSATGGDKPGVRLLTLTGPGGVGKTRLALEVAEESLEQFKDGVFLVELAPVTEPDLVVTAIAGVLQLREAQGSPLVTTIKEHLQNKRILLVLDNFEQILPAGAVLADLLASCPGLKLLVTSRSPLRLRGEREFLVSPLAVPEAKQHISTAVASEYGAVALFVQRATAVNADFELTRDNTEAVAEICRKVDGLPLAIELVAAHSTLLPPKSILARLTHPLSLLKSGARDGASRHKTMRDTIDWSYDLLTEQERGLFRRLSVFVGSFSLRAAEAICNADGDITVGPDDPAAIDVLHGVESLLEKNLVRPLQLLDDDQWLAMLETVRQYAWEQLVDSGEAEALRQRHADYYLRLAEQIGSGTKGPESTAALARLAAEQDNFRAVLQWLLDREEPAGSEDALRLIRALHDFWQQHMHLSEFRGWLDRALAQAGSHPTPLLAWSLQRAASLARWQGDFQRATVLGEESLAMARELGDEYEIASALNALGGIALYQGDYETAAARSGEALIKYRQLGADKEVATTLGNLGLAALYQGDFERAEEYCRECIRLLREVGHGANALVALTNLGYAAHYQGDWHRARETFMETLAVTLEIDPQRSSARALAGVAATMLAEADQHPNTASHGLRIAANAARLLGMSEARRERGGGNFDPRGQAEFERNVATARKLLGEEAFNRAWEEGGTLTLEQALELATRGYAHEDQNKPRGRGRPKKRVAGGLTDREYDVAALLARGMTNAEIAGQLVLSVRTVEAHVANAMQKLGLHTRTELAAWAMREGIVPHPATE